MNFLNRIFGFVFITCFALSAQAQLDVDNTMTVEEYVIQYLIGDGVDVTNITYNGQPGDQVTVAVGSFEGGNGVIGMESGMIMGTGDVSIAEGPNNSENSSDDLDLNYSDADLEQASGTKNLNDLTVVEFDFVPQGDSLNFNYVWASEEYPEFVNQFNDIFGFFLSGPGINGPYSNNAENIALVPGTTDPVSINTINNGTDGVSGPCENCQFYVNNDYNEGGPTPFNIEYNGFTVPLQAVSPVQCGETYHIKLAIADATDSNLDSGIFLENSSFTSPEIINVALGTGVNSDNNVFEGCGPVELVFSRVEGGEDDWITIDYTGNAIAGDDYNELPDSLFFPAGTEEVIWNLTAFADGVVEGTDTLTLTVTNIAECSGEILVTEYTVLIQDELSGGIVEDDFNLTSCDQTFELTSEVAGGRPDITYEWTDEDGNILGTDPELTGNWNGEMTYQLTITDDCMNEVVDEVTITAPGPIDIGNMPNSFSVICLDTINFDPHVTGGNGELSYSWLVNSSQQSTDTTFSLNVYETTIVTLIVSDECDNADTTSAVLQYQVTPVEIDIGEDVTTTCSGQTVLFPEIEGGLLPYSYQWYVDGEPYANTAQITIQTAETVQMQLVVEENCGFTDSDSLMINIEKNPIELTTSNDTLICQGSETVLSAEAEGGDGGFQYFWEPIGIHGQSVEVSPQEPTVYQVTARDICNDTAIGFVEVDVDSIEAVIGRDFISQTDISFSGSSIPPCEDCDYEWDFGDGASSASQNPVHSFDGDMAYTTFLTVTTSNGCHDSTSIDIFPLVTLYVPSAFTPDGDGLNDQFRISHEGIKRFEMFIYNRWGQVVFSSANPNDVWHGEVRDGNHYSPNDVYNYVIKYAGVDGEERTKRGTITIIR